MHNIAILRANVLKILSNIANTICVTDDTFVVIFFVIFLMITVIRLVFSIGEAAIRSKYARLTVLVPPDPPKITKGPILEAVEDSEVMLECVSVGGKPAAEVSMTQPSLHGQMCN